MSNSLLTINMITKEAVRLFRNSNAFVMNINRQYDDAFAKTGAKIGTTLRVRLPNDYVVTSGPALSAQDTTEQSTTLVVATQQHVDVSFSSVDRTMSLDDYAERILSPMVNNLAGTVASTIMQGAEGGVCNYVSNVNGSGAIISPTSSTFLDAGASLDLNSAQVSDRKIVADPRTMARSVSSLSGLFNPAAAISKQYKNARIYDALNFDWFTDQTVIKHTTGTFSAGGAISGAGQTGLALTVTALTGTLAQGDIITIEGVYAVNRVFKASTGELRQFVVTAAVASGATSIPIYPAIVPAVGGNAVQYQTVTASPASGAAVRLVNQASEIYRKNIAYAPDAVTMVTADLMLPEGVMERARESFDGLSMRMVSQYIIGTDQAATRLDILYGSLWVRPEWACVIADSIS